MNPLNHTLTQFGLDDTSVHIYLLLSEEGELTVPQIVDRLQLSRTIIYQSINTLQQRKCIDYRKDGRVVYYKATHPQHLSQFIQEKKRETQMAIEELESGIRQLTAAYNLTSGKPGVRFYEGNEGLKEALFHSLNATDTIYTFGDTDTINLYDPDWHAEYLAERIKRKIPKKIIMTDSLASRDIAPTLNKEFTEIKFINKEKYPFATAVEIYDNSISFLALTHEYPVAFLIEHAETAQFHRSLFLYMWDTLPST